MCIVRRIISLIIFLSTANSSIHPLAENIELPDANEWWILKSMFNICSHLSQSLNLVFPQMTRSARFRVVETGPIKIRAIQTPSPWPEGFRAPVLVPV